MIIADLKWKNQESSFLRWPKQLVVDIHTQIFWFRGPCRASVPQSYKSILEQQELSAPFLYSTPRDLFPPDGRGEAAESNWRVVSFQIWLHLRFTPKWQGYMAK